MIFEPGVLLLLVALGGVDVTPCQTSHENLEMAITAVRDAIAAYSKCLDGSNGRDDCSSEFGDLDLAQYGFEIAVAETTTRLTPVVGI